MTYYEILEISEKASQEVIRMAYKALCKKYHPDVYQGNKSYAEEQMKKINEAYTVLSDVEKRKQYDDSLKNNKESKNRTYSEQKQEHKGTNIDTLLKRGFMALEDGEWLKADDFFEQALNQDAELSEAYLGKLMIELRVAIKNELKNCSLPFDDKNNYQRAYRFADDDLRRFLVDTIQFINRRNYEIECNNTYFEACKYLNRDADGVWHIEKAISLFKKIPYYKDSSVKIQECEEKIAIIKEQMAKDEQIALEKKKKVFKIASITTPIVAVILATIILITTVIIPKSKYNDAMKLFESGKYLEAIEICNTIEQYDYAKELLEKSYYKLGILHFEKNEFELAYNYLVNSKDYKDSYDLRKSIMSKYFQDKKGKISAGMRVSLGLNADGTVRVVGDDISTQEIELVNKWTNIKEVSAGDSHLVALCSDGTVVTANAPWSELLEVNSWKNIVSVSAGMWHTVGLRADGTVVGIVEEGSSKEMTNVSKWRNIVAISASAMRTVGLKSDGTVISTKYNPTTDSTYVDQVDVSVFKNIVAISSEDDLVAGLKSDGTVIATGDNGYGQCEVSNWKDIVDISVNDWNTFGLKADGTVVVAGELKDDKRFSSLNGIVDISVGHSHFLGLKTDGTVISIRISDIGSGAECNVQDWDLY